MRGLVLAWTLLSALLGACAATAPVTCPVGDVDPEPQLSCEAAVNAARAQLASSAGVAALRFEYDVCPENARCAIPFGAAGNVIASLGDGTEVAVFVSIDADGTVRAEPPRLLESQPTPLS